MDRPDPPIPSLFITHAFGPGDLTVKYPQALSILQELALQKKLTAEDCALEDCVNRTLARTLLSRIEVPAFDNSAMDGFCVPAASTRTATSERPVTIPIHSTLLAGDPAHPFSPEDGWGCEVMTGAPLPNFPGAAVFRIEDVEVTRDAHGAPTQIRVTFPLEAGTHVRRAGSDFTRGQTLLPAGTRLIPEKVLALAVHGMNRVPVLRRPRIALISTGSEILPHSVHELPPGKVRNCTAPFLKVALPSYGAEVTFHATIADDAEEFETLLRKLLNEDFDLILSTGAVSMGQKDFIRGSLEKLGAEILFHRVDVRPGKPILCARMRAPGAPLLIGIPGNPVSTTIALRFFIGPYLSALHGRPPENPIRALLQNRFTKPEGLRCFFKGVLADSDAGPQVRILSGQSSHLVSPFMEANCWVELHDQTSEVRPGERIPVYPLLPDVWNAADSTTSSAAPSRTRGHCC